MAKSDLLNSAIVDATDLKKTAHIAAKLKLEETFQPTLQRMMAARLSEEDEFEEDGDDFDINIDIEPEAPVEPSTDTGVGMGSFDDGGEEPISPEGPSDDMPVDDAPVDDAPLGDEEETDLDLESIMRELDEPEEEMGDEEMFESLFQEEDEFMGDDETELIEAETDALYEFLELDEMDGLGDLNGPNDEDDGAFDETPPVKSMNFENKKLRNENRELKSNLNEALQVVTTLKKTINEVNLLNAKLMYTTKAFKTENLSESQKMKIMESIDRARNIREAKLVYSTIMQTLTNRNKKSIKEGLASKTVRALNPKRQLNENVDSQQLMWQRRAGLKPPADF